MIVLELGSIDAYLGTGQCHVNMGVILSSTGVIDGMKTWNILSIMILTHQLYFN